MTAVDKATLPSSPQMSADTYFVALADDDEFQIAKAYVKAMYPQTAAKLVRELRLDRLTDKHTVIALRRDDERSPVAVLEPSPTGQRQPRRRPAVELIGEIREAPPIRVAEFWGPGLDGDGEVDSSGFMSALGTRAIPAAVKNYPTQKTLKLAYA